MARMTQRLNDSAPMIDASIYRCAGEWCYALWIGGEYDHSDNLPDAETEHDARVAVDQMFAGAAIDRAADID